MAIKKTELYASLWASCDELRGGMDASQYKNYILTLLFVKYVTDKYKSQKRPVIVVPEGGSFDDMVAQKNKKGIGDQLNVIVKALAAANNMAWLSNADNDFNNEDRLGKGQSMVDTLTRLIGIFEGLDLARNRAEGDDLLGDAYEYLMRNFATESGKSKGQFYTPAEVSRVVAKILGIDDKTSQDKTVYDPTCGSGSLMLKVHDEAPNGLSLFGQEKDNATAALAKMNMILHNCPTAEIWQDDTLSDPHWKDKDGGLKTFDYAVANPPFSYKSWSNGINVGKDQYQRFEYGQPPEKNGDYAFLLHILKSLKSTGTGAVILPHGVLFRGNAEADVRRNLIRQGFIKGIIGLPANLFYGTGIPACIIVLDKAGARAERPIFMIDASKGYMKDGNKNRLRSQDIHKIVDVFTKQLQLPRYSRLIPYEEIAGKNDFNLNIPRYIDAAEPEDIHDLNAHLNGGIPNRDIDALQAWWKVMPSLRKVLFKAGAGPGYADALVPARDVKAAILNHPEFEAFRARCLSFYHDWQTAHASRLRAIAAGDNPKQLIFDLSEDLLARFADAPLLDKYDIYQILMNYWAETLQDDVYLLTQDGWAAANSVRELIPVKDKNNKPVYKEEHDFEFGGGKTRKRYKSDILPPALVIAAYFAEQQADIDRIQTELDATGAELETFIEENTSSGDGEAALLDEARTDNDKITRKSLSDRLKASDDEEEIAALKHCLDLLKTEADAKAALKAAKEALDKQVFLKIPKIPEQKLKELVVTRKWFATLEARIIEEIERVTQQLATRVKTLEERYAEPLPALTGEVDVLSQKVAGHLKAMGLEW